MITRGRYIDVRASRFFDSISNELIDIQGQSVLYYQFLVDSSIKSTDKYAQVYKETTKKRYKNGLVVPCIVDIDKKNTETFEDAKFENKTSIRVSFSREKLKTLGILPQIGDVLSFQRMFFEIYTFDDTEMHMGSPEFKYSINVEAHQIRIDKKKYDIPFDNELNI